MKEKVNAPSLHSSQYLNWRDRPEYIKKGIDCYYNGIQLLKEWHYNGDRLQQYALCEIDEYLLLKKIITSHPELKNFYVLDIGSGKNYFCQKLAFLLEEDPEILPDIRVHLIGVTGEDSVKDNVSHYSKCSVYHFGGIKIENLMEHIEKQNLPNFSVHLMVSRWCLRHLCDPLGTFLQMYELLAEKGYLLADGFYFDRHYQGTIIKNSDPEENMEALLVEAEIPFLFSTFKNTDYQSFNQFIIQKMNDKPTIKLALSYADSPNEVKNKGKIIHFHFNSSNPPKKTNLQKDWEIFGKHTSTYVSCSLFGSRELYEKLAEMKVFIKKGAFDREEPYKLKKEQVGFEQFQIHWNKKKKGELYQEQEPSSATLIVTNNSPIFSPMNLENRESNNNGRTSNTSNFGNDLK